MKAAICPNCQSSMTRTSVGNFCLSCGNSEHHQHIQLDSQQPAPNDTYKPMDVYIKTDKSPKHSQIKGFINPKVDHSAGVIKLSKNKKSWQAKNSSSKTALPTSALGKAVVVIGLIVLVGFITYISSANTNQ